MKRAEIYEKVVSSSEKYGPNNPQQIMQLRRILEKEAPEEVFEGLYQVFLDKERDAIVKQQLAGTLLSKIKPKLFINLSEVIKNCLDTWDVSIEELPFYLRDLCGIERVEQAINTVWSMELNKNEKNSLETIEWWLRLRTNG